ncbi:hypothetical protein AYK26_04315 [Euryarchaeota archaeon SM23-78]|nr:MAG: hypothetical protein AYK26_04315 [Euryarchaeota archaeon SM23-78]
MKKGIIALALICLLLLFVIGCKAPTEEPAGEEKEEVTEEPTLTGDITEVDDLDTDISDEELEDIDNSLDEITW